MDANEMKTQFSLEDMVVSLYLLEYLESVVQSVDLAEQNKAEMPSRLRFKEDLKSLKTRMQNKMAPVMYDYLIYALLRESLEAYDYCEICYKTFMDRSIYHLTLYNMKHTEKVDDKNVIQWMKYLYSCDWNDFFGGDKWWYIANVASLYKKVPNQIFIDSCIDLQHNTGTAFNKSWKYFKIRKDYAFQKFIGEKAKNKTFMCFIREVLLFNMPYEVFKIFERFLALYYRPENNIFYFSEKDLMRLRRDVLYYMEAYPDRWDSFIEYEPVHYTGLYKFKASDFYSNDNRCDP